MLRFLFVVLWWKSRDTLGGKSLLEGGEKVRERHNRNGRRANDSNDQTLFLCCASESGAGPPERNSRSWTIFGQNHMIGKPDSLHEAVVSAFLCAGRFSFSLLVNN
jgi:hypothetical protein